MCGRPNRRVGAGALLCWLLVVTGCLSQPEDWALEPNWGKPLQTWNNRNVSTQAELKSALLDETINLITLTKTVRLVPGEGPGGWGSSVVVGRTVAFTSRRDDVTCEHPALILPSLDQRDPDFFIWNGTQLGMIVYNLDFFLHFTLFESRDFGWVSGMKSPRLRVSGLDFGGDFILEATNARFISDCSSLQGDALKAIIESMGLLRSFPTEIAVRDEFNEEDWIDPADPTHLDVEAHDVRLNLRNNLLLRHAILSWGNYSVDAVNKSIDIVRWKWLLHSAALVCQEDLFEAATPFATSTACWMPSEPTHYYIGTVNTTRSNKPCQRWDHPRNPIVPSAFPLDHLEENYCRQLEEVVCVDGECRMQAKEGRPRPGQQPWCYVEPDGAGSDLDWEYCNVPTCRPDDCASPSGRPSLPYVAPGGGVPAEQGAGAGGEKGVDGSEDNSQGVEIALFTACGVILLAIAIGVCAYQQRAKGLQGKGDLEPAQQELPMTNFLDISSAAFGESSGEDEIRLTSGTQAESHMLSTASHLSELKLEGFDPQTSFLHTPLDGQEVFPLQSQSVPSRVSLQGIFSQDKVTLGELIGKGSFGAVYKGLWNGVVVAIKLVAAASTQVHHSAAIDEVKLAKSLRHPNIIATYGSSVCSCKPTMVAFKNQAQPMVVYRATLILEFGEGDLYKAMKRGLLTLQHQEGQANLKRILNLLRDIAHGMVYIHQQHIIHADLKPANIFYTWQKLQDGLDSAIYSTPDPQADETGTSAQVDIVAKIGDFGLSQVSRTAPVASQARAPPQCGTIAYAAPEALQDCPVLTPKADVFAFGIVMWELYTAEIPWQQCKTRKEVKQLVREGQRPTFPPTCPEQYRKLAEQCWQTDPEARPIFEDVVTSITHLQECLGFRSESFRN